MLSENLKAWRIRKGWARSRFASHISIASGMVRSFERGEIVPPEDVLEDIAETFELTVDELRNPPPVLPVEIPEERKETLAEASVETENWSQSEGGKLEKIQSELVSVPEHYAEVSVELGESSQTIENQEWKRAVVRITMPCPIEKLEETKERVAKEAREFLKQQTQSNMNDSAEYWKGKLGL